MTLFAAIFPSAAASAVSASWPAWVALLARDGVAAGEGLAGKAFAAAAFGRGRREA